MLSDILINDVKFFLPSLRQSHNLVQFSAKVHHAQLIWVPNIIHHMLYKCSRHQL